MRCRQYPQLSNLVYTASTNPGDSTSISIFTTEDADIASGYSNDPLTLVSYAYAPASTNYVGTVAVTTQPISPVRRRSRLLPNLWWSRR